jgi:RHS repeat-associated protein
MDDVIARVELHHRMCGSQLLRGKNFSQRSCMAGHEVLNVSLRVRERSQGPRGDLTRLFGWLSRGMLMQLSKRLVLLFVMACMAPVAFAQVVIGPGGGGSSDQGGIPTWVEYGKRIEATQHISALDNGFAGESVSLYNGATTFSVTDIDVPGNFALPVRLVRHLAIELQPLDQFQTYDVLLHGAGNWDVDVPYMAATYPTSAGCGGAACPMGSVPDIVMGPSDAFRRAEVWQGITIHVPGRGDATAMGLDTQTPIPSSGGPYSLTTANRDVFDSIPMKSGFSGQGFRMTTTAGVRYYFDVGTTRTASKLVKYIDMPNGRPGKIPVFLARNRSYLLASKIEDRFGNTVQFQYDASGHPTRIWSSDGREIVLTYSSGRLSSATSHGRTWQYQYDSSGNLSAVVLPDTTRWQYAYSGTLKPSAPPPYETLSGPWCTGMPAIVSDEFTLTATNPSGAVASFRFDNTRHYRSGVHASECAQVGNPASPSYDLLVPYFFDVMSLTQKTLSGPGLPGATWNYVYGNGSYGLWGSHTDPPNYPCTTCTQYKTVTVTNPDNTEQSYRFGIEYWLNDGRLLQTDTLRADGTVIRTEANTYLSEAAAGSQPFYPQYGHVLGGVADPMTARIRPVTKTVITQDGATFTTTVNNFDSYARVIKQTGSSTLGYSRIAETGYSDNTGKWVLGQIAQRKINGTTVASTTYAASTALPLTYSAFGKLKQTLTWNADGTLASVKDGNNHVTTASNWKRGIPQAIGYPDGTSQSASVNDSGWVTWVKDENGYTTSYGYDAMGRLASITYPTGDDVAWNQTLLSFTPASGNENGIPGGHWNQVVHTGNSYTVTRFDAMWRPLLIRHYDNSNITGTMSETVIRYDALGRQIFKSYPVTTISDYAAINAGVHTSYDALDRVTQVQQDSELGTLTTTTAYQSGFVTKVTDPRGYVTTTSYQAYGEPTTDYPDSITAPAGQLTVIMRDAFGKPRSITRTGTASGSAQLTRSYVYDANQQLCKRIDPESGATAFGYDGAGNVVWSAAGLNLPNAGSCDAGTAAASSRRVNRTYDTRNRPATLSFPDGYGDQTWTYTPDGLPAQVTTAGSGQNVVNTYTYDKRRLLKQESVQGRTGWSTWTITYGHDANAHLTSETLPIGAWSYAPDFAGRPTKLALSGGGTYISNVQYAPDGKVKQFTRANGIVRTVTENSRLLPSQIVDVGGGVTPIDQRYSYDKDANPTAITDYGNSNQTRTMTYDALDRVASVNATGLSGYYTYAYDLFDNLRTLAHTGGSTSTYNYDNDNDNDSHNRLTSIVNTANGTTTYAWDVQGNLSNRAGQVFQFSYGNRLVSIAAQASYRYDAWGRRLDAYDQTLGASLRSLYSRDGKLVFQQDYRGGMPFHAFQYLGGQLAVVVDYDASHAITVRYPHTDAQGTVVVYTNASRSILSRSVYDSWGNPRDHSNDDQPGYTGHFQDALTGLTYMQQRYYDSALERFVSTDPVGVDPASGGNFNRYWYANDNPYRYTDPDGRETGSTLQAIDRMTGGPPYVTGGTSTSQMLSSVADAVDALDDALAASPPEVGPEEHMAAVPVIAGLRKLAKVAKVAEKAEEGGAAAKRAENIAKGIPEARLGPSGKPMVHTVEHSTRKAAREAAEKEAPTGGSTRFDAHPQDGQKPHFQAEDARGKNVKPVVHHCVPSKSC